MVKLTELVNLINVKLNTNWNVTKLVDDKVFVSNYKQTNKFSKIQLYDIVLLEKDYKLYKYSAHDGAYINKNNEKIKIKSV